MIGPKLLEPQALLSSQKAATGVMQRHKTWGNMLPAIAVGGKGNIGAFVLATTESSCSVSFLPQIVLEAT